VLVEDVPGVGKTTLAVALAQTIGGSHHRIQFTSDLLPSDVLGVPVYNQADHSFEFKRGPIFANIVLADEINRTTPKTQSCMLEAMQDGKVSVDRDVHDLPHPFMVIATQNPIEHHGTYPLPESQLDRFMMRLRIGYPDRNFELSVLQDLSHRGPDAALAPVVTPARVLALQAAVREVHVDPALDRYILALAEATRNLREIELGISTRGTLMLHRAAQAWALLHGRDYVLPDDIKQLARPVCAHRLIVHATYAPGTGSEGVQATAELLLDRILAEIEVPR
jgi:MoxR-like ATPase